MIGRSIGHYRIVDQLGRGGSGTVYKAVDETLHREVAIKVLNPELADTHAMRRFLGEATILAKLNHPSIATIYEMFQSETDLLMVMEFVRGETLERMSDDLGPLPPDRAASLIERILSALSHAHAAGVVHRDMKPANVMVTDTGAVKLMDFGIARVRGAERMTIDGAMLGTPAYMAPEQVLSQDADSRTDLYSVGAIFYRLLTAALPFEAETPIAMLQRQLSDAPTPLRSHREALPDWCDAIVQRALAKAPAERFQTAEEFREALAHAAGLATTTELAQPLAVAPTGDRQACVQSKPPRTLVLSSADVGRPIALSTPSVIATTTGRTSALLGAAESAWSTLLDVTESARTMFLDRGKCAWSTLLRVAETARSVLTEKALPVVRRHKRVSGLSLAVFATTLVLFLVVPLPFATAPITRTRDSLQRAAVGPASGRLIFRAEALVGAGRWLRVREARVVLADGKVTVITDNDRKPLHSVAYESVTSINYSNSRDPMWRSPTGPARIARAQSGVLDSLGIVVDHHWISLGTNTTDRFVVLSVNDSQVGQVLSALEERTGLTTQHVR